MVILDKSQKQWEGSAAAPQLNRTELWGEFADRAKLCLINLYAM